MDALIPLACEAGRIALALLALSAAAHKLIERERTRLAASALLGVGPVIGDWAWAGAIAAEAIGGLLLASGAGAALGGGLLVALWTGYAVVLAAAAVRGGLADCGCSFGRHSPKPAFAIGRNLVLSASAATVALVHARLTPQAGVLLMATPAAVVFLILYFATDQLGANPPSIRSRS